MSKARVAKVSTKSGKNGVQAPKVQGDQATLTPEEEEAKLVDDLARLAISLHREALKELERY